MAARTTRMKPRRTPLTRERVIHAALHQADTGGLATLTMRILADGLGVAPMALYRHVANKEDLVDGMVDAVFAEIDLPAGGADWKRSMRGRAASLRAVLARHRWAIGLMESRIHPGPANLRHHDAMIGSLRQAGFSMAMTAHAYALLDSYIYGFASTQLNLPFDASDDVGGMAQQMLQGVAEDYPNLTAFAVEHVMKPGYDFAREFAYGLELILEGLERLRADGAPAQATRARPSA